MDIRWVADIKKYDQSRVAGGPGTKVLPTKLRPSTIRLERCQLRHSKRESHLGPKLRHTIESSKAATRGSVQARPRSTHLGTTHATHPVGNQWMHHGIKQRWGLGIRPARFDEFGKRGLLSERVDHTTAQFAFPQVVLIKPTGTPNSRRSFRPKCVPRRSSGQPLSETKVPSPSKVNWLLRGGSSLHFDVTQPWILRASISS